MYSFEEAQKEFEQAEKAKPDAVVNRLSSFRAPLSLKKLREPSFFQKMFSSSKLNRVHSQYFAFPESEVTDAKKYHATDIDADGNKNKSGNENDLDTIVTEEQDKQMEEDARRREKQNNEDVSALDDDDGAGSNDDEDDFEEHKRRSEIDDQYPLMPKVGKPVNIDRLVNRTKAAASGVRFLMEMMENDTAQSIQRARAIPVSKELDRVHVTPEISAVAAKVRSSTQVKDAVQANMTEIQRNLNYRKSALIMMNVNYSNQRVRKIDPIYIQEARTIVTYK